MTNNKSYFILIRGLLREQRHWGDFTQKLKQQFPLARIIPLDIPGNGCLHNQTSPNTIAELTDALRQQLPSRSQLNLIAISMGGMIAVDWMNRYPMEIKSTVLINSSLRNYSPFYQRLRWQNYGSIISCLFGTAEQMDQLILKLTSNNQQNDNELLRLWKQWREQYPVTNKSAFKQLLAAAKFISNTKPMHPLFIVASRKDQLVDYRCSLALKKAWQSDYQEHSTAGHDLPLDEPNWLIRTIADWYSGI